VNKLVKWQLLAQRPRGHAPDVRQRNMAIRQLLRRDPEQRRAAAGQEVRADDMNVAVRVEHEIA
jgi:hypothetical protein